MVAAEQDAEIAPRRITCGMQEGDLGGDLFRLVIVVATFPDADAVAIGLITPQLFRVLVRIVGNQRVGRAQHAVAAAIVLLQLDHLQGRVVLGHLQQVVRIGAAPGIDALVIVAHAGEITTWTRQHLQQAVLRIVGVLAFVHQQVANALAPGRGNFRIVLQYLHRQADQVVEIHRVERGKPRLVARIEFGRFLFARGLRRRQRFLWRQSGVLGARDQVLGRFQRVVLGARHQVLDLRIAVVGIEDREATFQAHRGMLDLQEFQPQCMERAQGQALGRVALQALAQALAHFLGGLVGEGDRRDALGRYPSRSDQMGDFLDDDPGLAAAGARQDQQGAIAVQDRVTLGLVEGVHAGSRCVSLQFTDIDAALARTGGAARPRHSGNAGVDERQPLPARQCADRAQPRKARRP